MKLSPLLLLLPCIHAFSVSLPTTVVTAVNALVSFIDNLIDPTPPLTPFDTWALTYGVTFEDSVDRDYRLSVWAHHDVFITAHNENSASYLVGHNAQSHLTGEEFASNRAIGPFATPPEHGRRGSEEVAEEEEDDDTPRSVNWVTSGAVSSVKNQGSCGSCWAFSAVGAISGAYFLSTGNLVSFSAQELIDCDDTDMGCGGGLMDYALAWEEKEGGLCTDADYPYTGSVSTCAESSCTPAASSGLFDFTDVPQSSSRAMKQALAKQPVSVAIDANSMGFRFYRSGVYDGECTTTLDHGVLAVGFGDDAKVEAEEEEVDRHWTLPPRPDRTTTAYWLVKNSWGESWGDGGYIKMARHVGMKGEDSPGQCGILMAASYPDFKPEGNDL